MGYEVHISDLLTLHRKLRIMVYIRTHVRFLVTRYACKSSITSLYSEKMWWDPSPWRVHPQKLAVRKGELRAQIPPTSSPYYLMLDIAHTKSRSNSDTESLFCTRKRGKERKWQRERIAKRIRKTGRGRRKEDLNINTNPLFSHSLAFQ